MIFLPGSRSFSWLTSCFKGRVRPWVIKNKDVAVMRNRIKNISAVIKSVRFLEARYPAILPVRMKVQPVASERSQQLMLT